MTRVRISFFKPTGFEDEWFVDTDDRGAALLRVVEEYDAELSCLNYVECSLCEPARSSKVLSLKAASSIGRAPDSGSGGCRFKTCAARQVLPEVEHEVHTVESDSIARTQGT